jgi:hypothetical protein
MSTPRTDQHITVLKDIIGVGFETVPAHFARDLEQYPEMVAGGYCIRKMRPKPIDQGIQKFWIDNEMGEGMEVTEQMVADMLEAFFKKNF